MFRLNDLRYFRYIIIQIACAQDDEHIEITLANKVENLILLYHRLLDTRCETVVYQLRGDARNRLFTCRVDIAKYHLIEL